jgi:hypothetical protein
MKILTLALYAIFATAFLSGCKFKGIVEVNPDVAQIISVDGCTDETPTIDCTIRNKTAKKIWSTNNGISIRCYTKDGVAVGAPGTLPDIEPGGATKQLMCPANNGVTRIVVASSS